MARKMLNVSQHVRSEDYARVWPVESEPLPGACTAGPGLAGLEARHEGRTDRAIRVHDDAWFTGFSHAIETDQSIPVIYQGEAN